MLGEATSLRESVSARFGSAELFATAENQIDHLTCLISFPAKSPLFTEGDPATAIYVLTRGSACLYKMLADGRKQIVGFALPGDLLGSPLSDRYPCSVDSISEVTARQLQRGPFLAWLKANPRALYFMLETASQETDASRDHMFLLGRGTAQEKVAEFVINWRARLGRRGALANLVPLPMSRREIADFLGLTIETVSRLLTKLERENVIRVVPDGVQLMGSTERPLLFERGYRLGSARQACELN